MGHPWGEVREGFIGTGEQEEAKGEGKQEEPRGRGDEQMEVSLCTVPPVCVSRLRLTGALWTYPLMDWGAAGSEPRFYISPRPLPFDVNRLPRTLLSKPHVEVMSRGVCSRGHMVSGLQSELGLPKMIMTRSCPEGGLATSERAPVNDGAKQEQPCWEGPAAQPGARPGRTCTPSLHRGVREGGAWERGRGRGGLPR